MITDVSVCVSDGITANSTSWDKTRGGITSFQDKGSDPTLFCEPSLDGWSHPTPSWGVSSGGWSNPTLSVISPGMGEERDEMRGVDINEGVPKTTLRPRENSTFKIAEVSRYLLPSCSLHTT